MRFSLKVICVVFVILFSIINVSAAEKRETKRVLILAGHAKNMPAVKLAEKGIQQVFQANNDYRIKLDIEYLDLYRFTSNHYKQEIVDLLRHKYGDGKIDVVITILTAALRFMLDYGDEIFPGIPTVFTVVTESNLKGLNLPGNVTGISYKIDIQGTLEAALKLQPNTKHVVLIGGISKTVGAIVEKAKKIFQSYKNNLQFTYLTDHSMDQILEQVARLPEDTVIFFVTIYRDKTGNVFIPLESMAEIVGKSSVPSYSVFETYLGHGIVGGRLVGFEVQGKKTAQYALAILKGKEPSDLPITSYGTVVPMFDWHQLQRWGLDEQKLPDGSIVHFKELTTWGEYRWYIIGGISLFIIEAILIFLLLFNWARRLKAESGLRKSHKELEHRVEERTAELSKTNEQLKEEIEERKGAEEALRESESRFREMFEQSPFGIALIGSLTGHIHALNPKFAEISGRAIEEMKGGDWMSITHPDDVQEDLDNMALLNAGKITGFNMDKRYIRPDGSHVWVNMTIAPVAVEDETHPRHLCMIDDITDLKQTEKVLRESREHLNAFLNNSPVGFAIWDREFRYVFINDVLQKINGPSLEEHIGKTVQEILPKAAPIIIPLFEKILSNCEPFRNIELSGELPSTPGKITNYLVSYFPISVIDGHPQFIGGIVVDITERKQAEEERTRLEDQLQQAQKMEAIGTLAGGIAHDFNNILAIILGNAELATDDVPDYNPASESLKEIRLASIRAKDMVQQLLAFSRKSEEESKPLKMSPIIKESMKMLRSAIPTSVEFEQHISDDPCNILGDPAQINQIMMNLVTNAADAMFEEGGLLEVTLEKTFLQEEKICFDWVLSPGAYVTLKVRDTGEGIDPGVMDRIFDPYYTTKEVGKGTGMGLSVIHGIVKSHGGGVRVESKLGEGTLFEIYFPALEKISEEEKKPEGQIKEGSEKILFVDDEESVVKLNHQLLERLGYQVQSTTKPLEALEWFKADPDQFDVIITDMTMPRLTGDRLAAEVLKIRPQMSVIICTGYSERMSTEKAEALGARKYLEKPIDLLNLASSLREVIEGK